jgi:arginine-tRNA-protein transferase
MFSEPIYIAADETGFKGSVLDAFLQMGYYRMQHQMFTTNYTQFHTESYALPVFWLRLDLKKVQESSTAKKIRKKCKDLKIVVKPAEINEEVRELYALYWEYINFITSDKCEDYLHEVHTINPFDSWMIEVRDHGRLVAVGYFDHGEKAIAGILNFFHPEYHAYSLGKLLILQKLDHATTLGCQYYYTGYLSTATEKFDYKLFPDIDAVEVFLPMEKRWVPYTYYGKEGLNDYIARWIDG